MGAGAENLCIGIVEDLDGCVHHSRELYPIIVGSLLRRYTRQGRYGNDLMMVSKAWELMKHLIDNFELKIAMNYLYISQMHTLCPRYCIK